MAMRVCDATDILGWHMFQIADETGEAVTVQLVEQRLAELLAGHTDDQLHQAARTVTKALNVYYRAIGWQHSIAAGRAVTRRSGEN